MEVCFKCRKCRKVLTTYPKSLFLSAHGHQLDLKPTPNPAKIEFTNSLLEDNESKCSSLQQEVLYINELTLPQWITDSLDKGKWTRGKLLCPTCSARLGAFDFVSGFHCACQLFVVPAVHLVRSKIDYSIL